MNRNTSNGGGTHWVAWCKNGNSKFYFDSYGFQPPNKFIAYLGSPVYYSTENVQPPRQFFCGNLCLHILRHLGQGAGMQVIVNDLYNPVYASMSVSKFGISGNSSSSSSSSAAAGSGASHDYVDTTFLRVDNTTTAMGSMDFSSFDLKIPEPRRLQGRGPEKLRRHNQPR